ncbi:hypothetical protein NQ317_019003 [Molorchus minor]|uniref:Uncharacterized protein n=1 Tax=Molorchus minor TaxID=1323400 RepID=A0ABQ9IV42_9CUCU|nr:hypothetical protein NQ317_019003 [Molorchus minor]
MHFFLKTFREGYWIGAVLLTDEAGFSINGIINSHNLHLWAEENPHASIVTHHKHRFEPINMWAGITGHHNLPELLDDLALAIRRDMWFRHDGARPDFRLVSRKQLLDRHFENRWIGRGGIFKNFSLCQSN